MTETEGLLLVEEAPVAGCIGVTGRRWPPEDDPEAEPVATSPGVSKSRTRSVSLLLLPAFALAVDEAVTRLTGSSCGLGAAAAGAAVVVTGKLMRSRLALARREDS